MHVGLIGFGRLGALLGKYLAQDCHLHIHDQKLDQSYVKKLGATPSNLESVCQKEIIIIAVPISEIENCLKEMSPHINPNALVIDVCSVKCHPIEMMKKYLPKSVGLLGTHPMFGPDSAAKGLFGCKIVLCKERIEDKRYQDILNYLETHGLKVLEATPEEHDQEISQSLLLTHFIGRSLIKNGSQKLNIDTVGYRRLMKILLTVENDSWQLFIDMNKYNPYSAETRKKFLKALTFIDGEIK